MPTIIETVTSDGNITFGKGEGVDIRITEEDESGSVDLSAAERIFEIEGVGSWTISVDPDNATGGRILLTAEQVAPVRNSARFYLRDETVEPAVNLWEGTILRRKA